MTARKHQGSPLSCLGRSPSRSDGSSAPGRRHTQSSTQIMVESGQPGEQRQPSAGWSSGPTSARCTTPRGPWQRLREGGHRRARRSRNGPLRGWSAPSAAVRLPQPRPAADRRRPHRSRPTGSEGAHAGRTRCQPCYPESSYRHLSPRVLGRRPDTHNDRSGRRPSGKWFVAGSIAQGGENIGDGQLAKVREGLAASCETSGTERPQAADLRCMSTDDVPLRTSFEMISQPRKPTVRGARVNIGRPRTWGGWPKRFPREIGPE